MNSHWDPRYQSTLSTLAISVHGYATAPNFPRCPAYSWHVTSYTGNLHCCTWYRCSRYEPKPYDIEVSCVGWCHGLRRSIWPRFYDNFLRRYAGSSRSYGTVMEQFRPRCSGQQPVLSVTHRLQRISFFFCSTSSSSSVSQIESLFI